MRVSVMITTSNRLEELQRTLQILAKLDPAPDEVLVTADGCTDGTPEFVSAMPNVKFIMNQPAKGSVASRDRMMREAQGDLVLALDDDSYPEDADCIGRITSFFKQQPNIAVLHFPQRTDEYPDTLAQTNFGHEEATRSFANSGAVLRRSTYLQLPGFEPRFYHMYEEPDYALQCVAAGHAVFFSPMITIRHRYVSRARDEIRIHHRHARNEFWSTLMRCPLPFAAGMVAWRVFSQFRYACKRGWSWVVREPRWWAQALVGVPYCLRKRKPVSWAGYKRWLSLP
ncbi:MAG TPA: glycosyltransferase family A protein [Candidatus Udaeobacter sp.]|jgi:GT2 family glycosyltransferase